MISWLEQNRNRFDQSFRLSSGENITDSRKYINVCIERLTTCIERKSYQSLFYATYYNAFRLKKYLEQKTR